MHSEQALSKYFGFTSFRQNQKEIIDSILHGENTIAVLPTGAGKSLCYQVPALISENFSIVISPLIALMKDQVDSINKTDEIAAFINSTMTFTEAEDVLQKIAYGKLKLLYIAPERLENLSFADRIKSLNPAFLFVDEAHCISEWGHNFRPSYRKIKELIDYAGIKKISAFTATATPEVITDIGVQLGLSSPNIFVRGFERDNLHLSVIHARRKKEKCLELISQFKTPAIIYTSSRKKAEEVTEYLTLNRIGCAFYHAGLRSEERKKIQEDFIEGRLPVIAATNAFGMGIDKKDIRLIVHYNMPGSIENYYQEIGRAGRDGKPSYAFLLFHENDINIQNFFLVNSHPDKGMIQSIYEGICDFGRVAEGNFDNKEIPVNTEFLSAYAKRELNKGLLYSVLRILENAGYLKIVSEYEKKTSVQINLPKDKLKEFTKSSAKELLRETVLALLREYGSKIFGGRVNISLSALSSSTGLNPAELEESLITLDNIGIIDFNVPLTVDSIMLTAPRVPAERIRLDYKGINESFLRQQKKIDTMVEYSHTDDCRFRFILKYFGEEVEGYKCGKCDNCSSGEKIPALSAGYLTEIILRTVAETELKFTEANLISILTGKSRIDEQKSVDTFGSCSNYAKNELLTVFYDTVSKGMLVKNTAAQNKLDITVKGLEYLREHGVQTTAPVKSPHYETDLELFNLLREARSKAAKRFLQSGSIICPDVTLREIIAKVPVNKEDLLALPGFSQRMFNKVGNDFLEIIRSYGKNEGEATEVQKKTMPSNIKETYSLLVKGYKLKDIASLRKLSEAVISMQIETILEYEPGADIGSLFDNDLLEKIFDEIRKGYVDLKDLKSRLPVEVTYPQIRIAAAKFKFASPSFSTGPSGLRHT